jgi:hypothetical protein
MARQVVPITQNDLRGGLQVNVENKSRWHDIELTKAGYRTYRNYFKYILEHKINAFIECWQKGMYWHAITHDLSKFRPSEFFPYAHKFFAGDYCYKYIDVERAFNRAWTLHYTRNKHHWNHWVRHDGLVLDMPSKCINQMICDWRAMGRKFGDSAGSYYDKNKDKMVMTQRTRIILEGRLRRWPDC